MGRPANVCLVVYVRPLGMVLLLFALGCNLVHEVLDSVNYVRMPRYLRSLEYSCSTYPRRFKCLELELPLQPFAIVPESPAALVDESCRLGGEIICAFASGWRNVFRLHHRGSCGAETPGDV